jgi:hypothetical protein
MIDRQRRATVRGLERLGYRWGGTEWVAPDASTPPRLDLIAAADAMFTELTEQIEDPAGCCDGSPDADDLERLVDLAKPTKPLGHETEDARGKTASARPALIDRWRRPGSPRRPQTLRLRTDRQSPPR